MPVRSAIDGPQVVLWTPDFFKMSSIRHQPVSEDCTRFTPTKAVNRNAHGVIHQPTANEARTNVPAMSRIL